MTTADLDSIGDAVVTAFGDILKPVLARVKALEARPLASNGASWAGVFKSDTVYDEGQLVTDRGSLWLARARTTARPSESHMDWKLIVKSGAYSNEGTRR